MSNFYLRAIGWQLFCGPIRDGRPAVVLLGISTAGKPPKNGRDS